MKFENQFQNRHIHKRTIRMIVTTEDIAEFLNVSPNTLRQWIHRGKLKLTGDTVEDLKSLFSIYRDIS